MEHARLRERLRRGGRHWAERASVCTAGARGNKDGDNCHKVEQIEQRGRRGAATLEYRAQDSVQDTSCMVQNV